MAGPRLRYSSVTTVPEGVQELEDRELIAKAAREHGVAVDPNVLLSIVHSAFAPHETMTAGERQFLVDAGAPTDSFDPQRQADARARLAAGSHAAMTSSSPGLTTAQAAERLGGRASANVRRSHQTRDLYAYARGPQGELVFPEWQFVDDRPLRGMRQVLTALPDRMHPVAVERWMTTPREELDDNSPLVWLSTGGDVDVVVWLAESFARR